MQCEHTQISVMGTHGCLNHIVALMVNNFLVVKFEETNYDFELLFFFFQERVKSVFHAKEFGKIINFKSPEDAKVKSKYYYNCTVLNLA